MQSDSIITAPSKTCLLKLRRIGDAAGQLVATQSRSEIPSIGDIIEITVNEAAVQARVFRLDTETADGTITVEADELSSGYAWEALSEMVRFDAEETQAHASATVSSLQPHLAFDATLGLVRESHAIARRFLDRPKPDFSIALRYMKAARRAGWLAFPYIKDEEFKRRVVGYKPMSEAEWEQFWPSRSSAESDNRGREG
jgi:hypothetical protein